MDGTTASTQAPVGIRPEHPTGDKSSAAGGDNYEIGVFLPPFTSTADDFWPGVDTVGGGREGEIHMRIWAVAEWEEPVADFGGGASNGSQGVWIHYGAMFIQCNKDSQGRSLSVSPSNGGQVKWRYWGSQKTPIRQSQGSGTGGDFIESMKGPDWISIDNCTLQFYIQQTDLVNPVTGGPLRTPEMYEYNARAWQRSITFAGDEDGLFDLYANQRKGRGPQRVFTLQSGVQTFEKDFFRVETNSEFVNEAVEPKVYKRDVNRLCDLYEYTSTATFANPNVTTRTDPTRPRWEYYDAANIDTQALAVREALIIPTSTVRDTYTIFAAQRSNRFRYIEQYAPDYVLPWKYDASNNDNGFTGDIGELATYTNSPMTYRFCLTSPIVVEELQGLGDAVLRSHFKIHYTIGPTRQKVLPQARLSPG